MTTDSDSLVERLEVLQQWHLKTAVDRVNKKKKKKHFERAETIAQSFLLIESLQSQVREYDGNVTDWAYNKVCLANENKRKEIESMDEGQNHLNRVIEERDITIESLQAEAKLSDIAFDAVQKKMEGYRDALDRLGERKTWFKDNEDADSLYELMHRITFARKELDKWHDIKRKS